MATVQRANVILDIPDEEDIIQKYKDKGYDVIDGNTGAVIERAMPHESGALQALVLELQIQVREKSEEVEALKKEVQKLKKKSKNAE